MDRQVNCCYFNCSWLQLELCLFWICGCKERERERNGLCLCLCPSLVLSMWVCACVSEQIYEKREFKYGSLILKSTANIEAETFTLFLHLKKLENVRNVDILLWANQLTPSSDSILLEVQILEYSILFFSSTRVPVYSSFVKKTANVKKKFQMLVKMSLHIQLPNFTQVRE